MEELQCLGTWKEGSSRYLLGRFTYQHHASNEERFRCFVYEKSKKGGVFSSPAIQVVQGNLGNNSAAAALTSNANNNNNGGGNQGQGQGGSSDVLFRVAQSGDATCNGLTPQVINVMQYKISIILHINIIIGRVQDNDTQERFVSHFNLII